MSEILPNLYLGSWEDARNLSFIDINKLTEISIVNCSKDLDSKYYNRKLKINFTRVPVDDNGCDELNLYRYLRDTLVFIYTELKKKNIVLVHCLAGQQRSPAVVTAYIMLVKKLSLNDAIKFVKSKRQEAFFTGVNFIESLNNWQTYLDTQKNLLKM